MMSYMTYSLACSHMVLYVHMAAGCPAYGYVQLIPFLAALICINHPQQMSESPEILPTTAAAMAATLGRPSMFDPTSSPKTAAADPRRGSDLPRE